MKTKKVKILSILLTVLMILGISPWSVFATNVEDKQIEGLGTRSENKYLTYMLTRFPDEHRLRFDNMSETNYWLTTKTDQKKYIAFCFNETKSAPTQSGNGYIKKFEDATEQEFKELAVGPIQGINFRNAVIWTTYLGYPGNKGNCDGKSFFDRAIDFYHIPKEYAEDAVHVATQMAVWYFTDYDKALGKFWSKIDGNALGQGDPSRITICKNYDQSMGDPITYLAADIVKLAYDKHNENPDNMKLDLYKPVYFPEKRQNLLVTQYTEMEIEHNPIKVKLDIRKKMDNGRNVADREFSFNFTGTDSNKTYQETVYNNDKGEVVIPELTFNKPGDYQFYIQENMGNDPNVEYQTTKFPINISVTGIRDLTAKVTYGDQGNTSLVITNKVKAPQVGKLKIIKNVIGEDADPNKEFSFTITLKDKNNQPISETFGQYKFDKGITKVKVSKNKPVIITDIPVGTKYTVTEDDMGTDSNYILTSQNNLTGTIELDKTSETTFENTAKPKPKYGNLKITKTVNKLPEGQNAGKFTFTIQLDDKKADTKNVKGAKFENGEATVSVEAGGSILITGLPAGVGYTVKEHTPDGYAVTSTGTTGKIVADEQKDVNFVNTYLNTGELTIQKIINGSASSDSDVFNFKIVLSNDNGLLTNTTCTLKLQDGTIRNVKITNGELEVSITGSSFVTIKGLPVGVQYQVSEKKPDGTFTSTADNVVENGYKLTNITGNNQITRADKAMKVVFTNTKNTEKGYLQIVKEIEGSKSSTEDKFDFRITLKTADGKPVSGTYLNQNGEKVIFDTSGQAVVTVKGGRGPIPSFVKINDIPVGTKYTVEEFTGKQGEYTSSVGSIVKDGYVLKKIDGNASGTINAGQNGVKFLNRKASTSITVKKTIAGNVQTKDIFTFEITLAGDGAKFNGDRSGVTFKNGQAEVSIQGSGTKTITDLPECNYTIVEKPIDGWIIPEKQTGTLTDNSTKTVVFENVKKKVTPASVSFSASKTLDGKVPQNAQFTFLLKDSNDKILDTKTNKADGTILFDKLSIDKEGVYTYKILEQIGDSKTISYDTTVYTAIVNVSKDNKNSILKAEVIYKKNNSEIVSNPIFKNTTKPETTHVTVTKKWVTNDGRKPTSFVTVALLKDGVQYKTVKLNDENKWTYTWEELNKDSVWTVKELDIPEGFESSVEQKGQDFTITNDDKPETTHVTVTKKWVTNDGRKPTSFVTVALLKDGVQYKTVKLNDENKWTYTWEELNKDSVWTVKELDIPEGFESSVEQKGQDFTITNDDKPETTHVTVTKKWVTNDGRKPTSFVTVALLKDGVQYKTVKLNDENKWTYTWEELNKDSVWTVKELDIPEGFESSVEQKGQDFTITNDDKPETTHVTVTKKWVTNDGRKPTSFVTVALLKDGVQYKTVKLNDENKWTYTWEELNKDSVWTVKELDIPEGFESSVEQKGQDFTITNDDIHINIVKPNNSSEKPNNSKPEIPKTKDNMPISMQIMAILSLLSGIIVVILNKKKYSNNK